MSFVRFSGMAVAMAFAMTACSKEKAEAPAMAAEPAPAVAPAAINVSSVASATPVKVYKDPNCGCCKEWIKHLEQNGFKVEVVDMPDLSAVKAKYGVTPELLSCHTAVVGNYTVEGHVPADLIVKMLNEKPAIAGLAVPGMPMGSPGMEGGTKQSYDVLTFDKAGKTAVYAHR